MCLFDSVFHTELSQGGAELWLAPKNMKLLAHFFQEVSKLQLNAVNSDASNIPNFLWTTSHSEVFEWLLEGEFFNKK